MVRTNPDSAATNWTFVHGPNLDDPLIGHYVLIQGDGTIPSDRVKTAYFATDGQGRQYGVGNATGQDMSGDGDFVHHGGKYAGGTLDAASFGADRSSPTSMQQLSFFRNRWYDQQTGRWTQEDPIGVAGGLNLYQFNGNNPVAYTDPFGLSPCPPCFNPLKAGVGAINVLRGVAQTASGVVLLTGGAVTAPLGPISVPASALGTAKVASGLAKVSRGGQQISESTDDPNGPSARNLLGLLPAGQKFDDPGEPTPVEYAKDKVQQFVTDPVKTAVKAVKDFFAID